jgi:Tfp pilus assembly protein PilN
MRAVNLIPPEQRRGATGAAGRSGGAVYVVLGALGGLVAIAALWAVAHHQVADRQAALTVTDREANQAQTRAQALSPYTQFAQLRAQRTQAISTLASQRVDWAQAMRAIASTLPGNVRLLSLNASIGGAAAPGAPGSALPAPAAATAGPAGGSTTPAVHLTGCASSQTQVADVISRLRALPGVTGVSLASSEKGASGGGGGSCGGSSGPPQFSLAVAFGAPGGAVAPAAGGLPVPAATRSSPSAPARGQGRPTQVPAGSTRAREGATR